MLSMVLLITNKLFITIIISLCSLCLCGESCLCKLLQELEVILKEQAKVINPVTQHGQSLYAHTEGIAGELFVVDTDGLEYIRVYHAATKYFNPAGVTTNTAAFTTAHHALNIDFR